MFEFFRSNWKRRIENLLRAIMANELELKTALDGIKSDIASAKESVDIVNTGIDTVLAKIVELKDQVANGVVSQSDLDALVAEAQELDASGDTLNASLESAKSKVSSVG